MSTVIEAVNLTKEQIVDRFGLSPRLAARVCALRAKGLGVSPGFLESVRPGCPAERLLLRTDLLRNASRMTPERFGRLAGEIFGSDQPPVLAVNPDGSRVIALSDQVEHRQVEVVKAEDAVAVFSPVGTGLKVIGEEETRKLFTPEEVSRLKIVILTSADPAEKIEAIRRLALSPLNPTDKGMVLIHALADSDAAVRVEAADALSALGLTPGIASAARSLGEGNLKQRIRAAERMGALAEQVGESEISVILTMLAGAINSEESDEVKTTLIRSFKGACGVVARSRAYAAEMVRLLVRQLEGAPEVLYRPVREILGEVGRRAPGVMTELIIQELMVVKAPPLRWLLFGVLATFPVPQEHRAQLARMGVADLEASDTPEEDCKGIGGMLCDWGVEAVKPLLAALPESGDAQKIYIVRLIDEIVCHRGGDDAAQESAAALLDLLRVSNKHVRVPIIETRVITHPKLSDALKARMARELLDSITDFANPRMKDVIEADAVRLGKAALEAARGVLIEEDDHARRQSACRVMAEIVEACKGAAKRRRLADDMLAVCVEEWEKREEKKGYLAETIARISVCSSAPPEQLTEIAADFKDVVFNIPEPSGVLLALGHISASSKLDIKSRFDIAQTLFELLDATLPELTDKVLASTTNDDDVVYHFGSEVTAYTEMIPACLEGLEKIYFGTRAKSLRARIADFLIEKWNETSNWTTIWGPDALELLMHALSRIARDDSTNPDCRGKIVEALGEHLDFMPVVEEIGAILAADQSLPRIGAAACEIGSKLLQRASRHREDQPGPLLKAIGAIAARTSLGKDPEKARKLRERTLQMLYSGVKEGLPEAVEALRRMKDCPALPAATREEIGVRVDIVEGTGKKKRSADSP